MGQRISARVAAGLAVGVVAVIRLVGWSPLEPGATTILAVAAGLGAPASYAVAGNFARARLADVAPLELATGMVTAGALVALPVALLSGAPGRLALDGAVSLARPSASSRRRSPGRSSSGSCAGRLRPRQAPRRSSCRRSPSPGARSSSPSRSASASWSGSGSSSSAWCSCSGSGRPSGSRHCTVLSGPHRGGHAVGLSSLKSWGLRARPRAVVWPRPRPRPSVRGPCTGSLPETPR